MTEAAFADDMAVPADGFDAMAPENVPPLVVWLGSTQSSNVTGRVFEVEGGLIRIADGWRHGPFVDNGDRWNPADIGPAVDKLIDAAAVPVPVYGAR
jgi:hypothetical protein